MTDVLLILLLIPSIALVVCLAVIIAITLRKFDDYEED